MSRDAREPNGHFVRELHGITLAEIVEYLVAKLGWSELGARIPVRCFNYEPSVKSSLSFLRRTPWARAQVEALYVAIRSDELTSQR